MMAKMILAFVVSASKNSPCGMCIFHKGSKMYHKNNSQPDSKYWETKPIKIQSFSLQYAILIFDIIYNSDVI